MASTIHIDGSARDLLLIGDHASNHVPENIDLGIPAALLEQHIAIDIGVAPLAAALCSRLSCAGLLGGVSRLVIDYNREIDAPGVIPTISDGRIIPGNRNLDEAARLQRIDRYWSPYHAAIAKRIAADRPGMLISLHSFTPQLESDNSARPWEIGILYNQDERAARIAIPLLEAADIVTGDNLPYSGKELNATMNTHAEANAVPYLGIEVRQDLIATADGVVAWAEKLAPIIAHTAEMLARADRRGQ